MGRYDVAGVLHELRYRWRRQRPARQPATTLPSEPFVSMICVSNRPQQAAHVRAVYDEQDWVNKELIVVANVHEADMSAFAEFNEASDATLIHRSPHTSLGSCLNAAIARATGAIVVRVDDDDFYASGYVASVVADFQATDAAVVGRAEYFAYVESVDQTVKRFPGRSNQYVARVAGGTIAVRTDLVRSVEFPELSIGEDVAFLRACERRGLRIWAAAPEGFLQIRRSRGGHTWDIADADFVRHAVVVAAGRPDEAWQAAN